MNINNFEKHFNKTILKRGVDYYADGHVEDLMQINEHNWQAEVYGSSLYVVDLRILTNGNISYIDCDCPYEDDCKHIVAALYEVRAQWQAASTSTISEKNETLQQMLQTKTKEQLIHLILNVGQNHPAFTHELKMLFTTPEDSLKAAEKLIAYHINIAEKHGGGFIPWNQVSNALVGIETVQERIGEHIEKGEYFTVVELSILCLQQALEAMLNSQDSGEFGNSIEESLAFIEQAIWEGVDIWNAEQYETVFELVSKEALNPELADWTEWYTSLLQSCIPLCKDDAIEKKYMSLLNSLFIDGDKWSAKYTNERLDELQFQLISSKYSKEDVAAFLEQNIENPNMREQVIISAMELKDYTKVVQLSLEGQQQDQDLPGLVDKWRCFAFKAHKKLNQTEEMRELAVQLLLSGDYNYYGEFKLLHSDQQWPQTLEQLLNQLQKASSPLYAKIIVQEQLPARILAYCKEQPVRVERYYSHINEHYYEEVCALFIDTINTNAKDVSDRKGYQEVCHSIKIMRAAGYIFEASQLITDLLQTYPKRRAFVDELQMLG
ncbi:MAG: SWIM zinc finger family protein [Solibacillus sp.]